MSDQSFTNLVKFVFMLFIVWFNVKPVFQKKTSEDSSSRWHDVLILTPLLGFLFGSYLNWLLILPLSQIFHFFILGMSFNDSFDKAKKQWFIAIIIFTIVVILSLIYVNFELFVSSLTSINYEFLFTQVK